VRQAERGAGRGAVLRNGGGGADEQLPVSSGAWGVQLRGLAQEQAVAILRGRNGGSVREEDSFSNTASGCGQVAHGRGDNAGCKRLV
jgi:hypothetical protein